MRVGPLLACLLMAAPAAGQFPVPTPGGITLPDTLERERDAPDHEGGADTLPRLRALGGAHWTTATGPAAHLALMLADKPGRHGEYGGPILSLEPGLNGGKFGLGMGAYSLFGSALLRGSYLRSWGEDGSLAPGQGYLGLDARMTLLVVALGIGWHGRVTGDAAGDGSIFTFSIGIGF